MALAVRLSRPACTALVLCALLGCTHTATIGLLSDGDLANRRIDPVLARDVLEGESCGPNQYLAAAFRNAIAGTGYDTMIDVDVTTTTAVVVVLNCIRVRGAGLRSAELPVVDPH